MPVYDPDAKARAIEMLAAEATPDSKGDVPKTQEPDDDGALPDEYRAIIDELRPEVKEQEESDGSNDAARLIKDLQAKIVALESRMVSQPAAEAKPDNATRQDSDVLDQEITNLAEVNPALASTMRGLRDQARQAEAVAKRALEHVNSQKANSEEEVVKGALAEAKKRFPYMDEDQVLGSMLRNRARLEDMDVFAKHSHTMNAKRDRELISQAFARARTGARLVPPGAAPKKQAADTTDGGGLDLRKDKDALAKRALEIERQMAAKK